mmetsp:Transcript_93002/g.161184  ORF Transcript_93002/g.161184 Transcript_93002/m.161184 type:complete len:237 (+) Transcript_93002:658-1368(+)
MDRIQRRGGVAIDRCCVTLVPGTRVLGSVLQDHVTDFEEFDRDWGCDGGEDALEQTRQEGNADHLELWGLGVRNGDSNACVLFLAKSDEAIVIGRQAERQCLVVSCLGKFQPDHVGEFPVLALLARAQSCRGLLHNVIISIRDGDILHHIHFVQDVRAGGRNLDFDGVGILDFSSQKHFGQGLGHIFRRPINPDARVHPIHFAFHLPDAQVGCNDLPAPFILHQNRLNGELVLAVV